MDKNIKKLETIENENDVLMLYTLRRYTEERMRAIDYRLRLLKKKENENKRDGGEDGN